MSVLLLKKLWCFSEGYDRTKRLISRSCLHCMVNTFSDVMQFTDLTVMELRLGPHFSRTYLNRNSLQNFTHLNSCQGKLLATWVCYKYPAAVVGSSPRCVLYSDWMWMSLRFYRVVNNWVWLGRGTSLSPTCAQLEGEGRNEAISCLSYWHLKELKYICVLFSFLAQSVEQAKQAWPDLASPKDSGKDTQGEGGGQSFWLLTAH